MSSQRMHEVRVHPLPSWLDAERLLGAGFRYEVIAPGLMAASARLRVADAADVAARLRGLGFGGERVSCELSPPLDRNAVRRARTEDARRRRDTTPGFTRKGTRLDVEGRFSLTPEALALRMARRMREKHVLDAGCGAGGNAIAFARAGARVTAVERDPDRLELARHNAGVYGVQDRIRFVAGDAIVLARELEADVLFVDPPWGERWDRVCTRIEDLPLFAALLPFAERFEELSAKLPPSFDTRALPKARPRALFGEADGDARRVKLLWLTLRARS